MRAHERLEKAVARLDRALRKGGRSGAGNGELAHELDAVRSENASLRGLNATVSDRLDATISRLRDILKD